MTVRAIGLFGFLAGVLAVVGAEAAPPQTVPPDVMLAFYLKTPDFKSQLSEALSQTEPSRLRAACPEPRLTKFNEFYLIAAPVFEQRGRYVGVNSGSWITVAHLDRCGTPARRRVLFEVVRRSTVLKYSALLPGDFRGDLRLEADARRAFARDIGAATHCDAGWIAILDVVNNSVPGEQDWSETWSADVCGQAIKATVSYAHVPGGIAITAALAP